MRRPPRYHAALTVLFLLLTGCAGIALPTAPPQTPSPVTRGMPGAPTARGPATATLARPATTATTDGPTASGRNTATRPTAATVVASATPTGAAPDVALHGPQSGVTTLAWSPDGRRVAAAAGAIDGAPDPRAYLWAADGTPVATMVGHTGPVTSLAWSPDGRTLATGSRDGTVRLWDANGAAVRTLVAPPEPPSDPPPAFSPPPVFSLAWSPDGGTLASGAISFRGAAAASPATRTTVLPLPGLVRLWRVDGTLAMTLTTAQTGGKFLGLAWSPDGALLAAGAMDYRIWRADGTPVATLRERATPAWALAWSPDSRTLAIGDENSIVALYTAAGTLIDRRSGVWGWGVAFAPDDRTLAVNDAGTVLLEDPATSPPTGSSPQALPQEHNPTSRYRAVWSPDGLLATVERDRVVRLWRADGAALGALDGCGAVVDVLAWSPDGTQLAGGGRDGAVCLWRAITTTP